MIFAPSPGASGLIDGENPRATSTPCFDEFDPTIIPYQYDVIKLIRDGTYDYRLGPLEILLSGAVGSAKSILAAHIGLTHVLMNNGARLALCRRSMPDLKATILVKVLEHMHPKLVEGVDYSYHRVSNTLSFTNGSQIICRSWADGKYFKFRSLELSAAIMEELTENDDQDQEAYKECFQRLGRLPHVKENWIISCTNPDSPRHWAYKRFFIENSHSRRVFKSKTEDNPFLPPSYVKSLRQNLDPREAARMLDGEWIEIKEESIYHAYDSTINFKTSTYKVDPTLPIHISHDFNIGLNKPMSACAFQYHPSKDEFHFFKEWIVHNCSTEQIMGEIADSGILNLPNEFIVNGDSAGKHKDTRSKRSDYDIILSCYLKAGKNPKLQLTAANPPIRTRHNLVNAYCKNMDGKHRLFIHGCKTLDEAMRLSSLLKGSSYAEDDSKPYQHVGTALGYGIHQTLIFAGRKASETIQL